MSFVRRLDDFRSELELTSKLAQSVARFKGATLRMFRDFAIEVLLDWTPEEREALAETGRRLRAGRR